jgi:hypothetical protein
MHACTKLNGRLVRARTSTSRIPALVQVLLRVHEHNGCTLQYAYGARMYKLKLIDQAYTRARLLIRVNKTISMAVHTSKSVY